MLVFTRKCNDAVMIGEDIEVRVLRVGRDSVRLGVRAPMSVPVHRLEVYEQIRQQNRLAAEIEVPPHDLLERLRRSTRPGSADDRGGAE